MKIWDYIQAYEIDKLVREGGIDNSEVEGLKNYSKESVEIYKKYFHEGKGPRVEWIGTNISCAKSFKDGNFADLFAESLELADELAKEDGIYENEIFIMTKIKELDGSYKYSAMAMPISYLRNDLNIWMNDGSIKLVVKEDDQ